MAKGCLAKTSQGNHNEVNEYVSDRNVARTRSRSLFRVKESVQRATAHGRLSSGRLREDFAMRMLQTKIETTVLCEPGSRNAHGHLARFTRAVLCENEKWRAPRSGEPTPWGSLCGSLRSRNARWTSCRARLIEKIQ